MIRKRLISILMMLTMVVTMMPSLASADTLTGESQTYILLRAKSIGTKKVDLTWNKTKGATKYVVYGNRSGKNNSVKLATVKKNKYTVEKIRNKKLLAHKIYKFQVKAYQGNGKLGSSKTIYFITGNTTKKYGNAKKIVANRKTLKLESGEKAKVFASVKIYNNKKHLKIANENRLRFISSNTKIAKVSKTGVVRGIAEGTATIYIQDISGKYCKTKVIVTDGAGGYQ